MKFKIVFLLVVSIMTGALAGCQQTPSAEAIAQKGDVSALVKANKSKAGQETVRSEVNAPETDKFEMVSESGNTTVNVDAKVVVPETNSIKIAKVINRELSSLDLKGLSEYFFEGKEYQVSKELSEMSKAELGKLIEEQKAMMEDATTYEWLTDEEKEDYKKQDQDYLLKLQEYYDKASETEEEVPIVYELKPVENKKVGEDAKKFSVEMVEGGVWKGFTVITGKYYNTVNYVIDGAECGFAGYFEGYENKCKYSEDEAKQKCEEVIKLLGISGEFQLAQCLPAVSYSQDSGTVQDYYCGYQIVYKRDLDNVSETYEGQSLWTKSFESEGSESGTEVNLPKDYENIYFVFNEDGICAFSWKEPMEVEKVLAENVKMISYEEAIKVFKEEAFEKSIMLAHTEVSEGQEDQDMQQTEDEQKVTYNIDQVKLGYMRVQNKDKEGGYTLIPVWDFFSTSSASGGSPVISFLTINAIDGSIIDRGLGY